MLSPSSPAKAHFSSCRLTSRVPRSVGIVHDHARLWPSRTLSFVLVLHFVLQRRVGLNVSSLESSSPRVVQLLLIMQSTMASGDHLPATGVAE